MMQCKAKSENLAQILGYQNWAVTNLPPLRESRPEIPRVGRGMRETRQPLASTIFSIPRQVEQQIKSKEHALGEIPRCCRSTR